MIFFFRMLRGIYDHPLNKDRKGAALLDFARWQIRSRLAGKPLVYSWINGTKVLTRNGETGFTGNIYYGLQDFPEMSYLLHVLREGDVFVDVGTNVGSYTLLASSVRRARSICFEPVPATFSRLKQNLDLNNLEDRVAAHNLGVADKPGLIRFSVNENCCNHVLGDDEKQEGVAVNVVTLDQALDSVSPSLMKIDVEGFELPVLRGASKILQRPELHSIVLEWNADENRYGYHESDLMALLKEHDFAPYQYDPFRRTLTPQEPTEGNTIFVRQLERVNALLRSSEKFRVKDVLL
jgi:FkbM family methyltransferase